MLMVVIAWHMTDITGKMLYFGLVLLTDLECITDSGHVLFYEGENVME